MHFKVKSFQFLEVHAGLVQYPSSRCVKGQIKRLENLETDVSNSRSKRPRDNTTVFNIE